MRAPLLLALLATGCDPGCRAPPPEPTPPPEPAPREVSPRCAAEARAASVVFPPGTGDIDGLSVACRDGLLGAFILRGHVLSHTARRTSSRGSFSAPVVVGTGADRLGPVATDAPGGPVAWRSPTAGLDAERDDVWAAWLRPADGGDRVARGDAVFPEGVVGLGVPFARTGPRGILVLATVARQGVAPSTHTLEITPGREEPAEVRDLAGGRPGHVEAWEPARGLTLARVEDDGASYLEARRGSEVLGRHRLRAPEAVVVPRGEATGAGAVFAVGEFAVGRGDAGACVGQPGGICVRPGRVYLLVVPPSGPLREIEVAPQGVPDALGYDGRAVTVLYVEPAADASTTQRAARIDVERGGRASLDLSPPEGFPPIDAPRLARCGDELWLVSAISLPEPAGPRVGVTALPLSCVLR